MIFLGLHFVGDIPFERVFIHPMVRDPHGKKMSKSIGNTIDPLDVMEEFGTDATRLGFLGACSLGLDISFAPDRMEGSRRFCNKLWNASRFVLSSELWDGKAPSPAPAADLGLPERWILSRLTRTQEEVDRAIEAFEFGDAAQALYHFVWSDFCDWYLEMAKLGLGSRRTAVASTLYQVLEETLRLAHPMIPFVTEEIWQKLPKREGTPDSIMIAQWPAPDAERVDEDAEREMHDLQEVVVEIRRFRHEHKIAPRQRIEAVASADPSGLIERYADELKALASLSDIRVSDQPPGWFSVAAGSIEIYVPLGELTDLGAERERIERDLKEAEKLATNARAKLDNPKFVSGAPPEVVSKARAQLEEHTQRVAKLRAQFEELGS
jgi:valyl-tRNA synthetase